MKGELSECMLLQIHAMYPNGPNDGHLVDDDNDSWRCFDTASQVAQVVYSLQDLPSGIIKSLVVEDSAHSFLQISSTSKLQDNGLNFQNENMLATSDAASHNIDYTHRTNKILVKPGATVSIIRGNEAQERIAQQEGGCRLAPKQGTNRVLVMRVTDSAGLAPTKSATQLSDDIFGTRSDQHNVVSTLLGPLSCCSSSYQQ